MVHTRKEVTCPCGGGMYAQCCGRFHAGAVPDTAEQLMRSRYSAYVLNLTDYVYDTWDAGTRPQRADLDSDGGTKWLGLDVKRHVPMGDEAIVEFVARYKIGGRAQRLHETSRFVRVEGRWFYLSGNFPETQ